MKFLPLIWAGLWRKPVRTLFTLLSIVVAFLLFGLLQGVNSAFALTIQAQRLDRMFIDARFQQPLKLSYKPQILQLGGIKHLTEIQFVGGSWQDPKNGNTIIWTNPDVWLSIRPEYEVPKDTFERIRRVRDGVVISSWQAQAYGWKVGDRITLRTGMPQANGDPHWTFEVVAIMHNAEARGEVRIMLANYSYLDEGRIPMMKGMVSRYLMVVEKPEQSAAIAKKIDALFANSPAPTRTQSEQETAQASISSLGDVQFFTRAIMGAVFFALLLLTANTMMESVRERTSELAALKTLGFTDLGVLALVLSEAVTLFLTGAVLGLAAAAGLFPLGRQFVGRAVLPMEVAIFGLLMAILVAFVSAGIPAWRAKRLNIVAALAVR